MTDVPHRRSFRITTVRARNFRSLADTAVELDRLTMLVGPNGSGKGHVLDALRFVGDALRLDPETAAARRPGPDGIRRRTPAGPATDMELGLTARADGCDLEYGFLLAVNAHGGIRVRREQARVWIGSQAAPVTFRIEDGKPQPPAWPTAAADTRFPPSDLWLGRLAGTGWAAGDAPRCRALQALAAFRASLVAGRFHCSDPDADRLAATLGRMQQRGAGTGDDPLQALREALPPAHAPHLFFRSALFAGRIGSRPGAAIR